MDSCKHTVIDGCTFGHGGRLDLAEEGGRGAEGNDIGRVSGEDMLITSCTLSDSGFACIGIGSETSGGVRGVRIEKCKFVHARLTRSLSRAGWGGVRLWRLTATDLDVLDGGKAFCRLRTRIPARMTALPM